MVNAQCRLETIGGKVLAQVSPMVVSLTETVDSCEIRLAEHTAIREIFVNPTFK